MVAVLFLGVLCLMSVIYTLIFLSLFGALDRVSSRWKSAVSSESSGASVTEAEQKAREVRRIAKKMLW